MNRGELRSKLSLKLRIPPAGDPTLTETVLNDAIRLALRDISGEKDWPWLTNTAVLTFTLASTSLGVPTAVAPAPTTMVKTRDLMVNSVRARYVDLTEFLDTAGSLSGLCVWTLATNGALPGTIVHLSPRPAVAPSNNILIFIQGEPDLTADTQSPLIPEAWHGTVLARAAFHSEIMRGKADAAQIHNMEYEGDLRQMHNAVKRRTGPRQIREAGYQIWATW